VSSDRRQRFVSAGSDRPVMPEETTHRIERLIEAAVAGDDRAVLARALDQARTTRDRQLVAVAAAHLDRDDDLFEALVRDHLADHPDSVLAARIATRNRARRTSTDTSTNTSTDLSTDPRTQE
jgi:hypothetical protein